MSHAAQAYARTSHTTASPREIEVQALLKAARQLQEVQANWKGPDRNLHNALMFNLPDGSRSQRESELDGSASEHRQYWHLRAEADHRDADGSASLQAEVAD